MSEIFISKFHPAIEDGKTLKALFVSETRKKIIEDILNELRLEREKDTYLQAHLLYGPAGIGKTFLLCILFHYLKEDEGLNKSYLAILLPEEVFGVSGVGDIFSRAIETAIENPGRTNADDEIKEFLKQRVKELKEIKDKFNKFKKGKGIFDEIKERFNKTSIIMFENLEKLVEKNFDKKELNNLLEILPRSKSIKIIASSVSFLEVLKDLNGSLYGYFRLHPLEPLTDKESYNLISLLVKFYSEDNEKLSSYFHSSTGSRRIKIFQAISYLSGGLPRMIYPLFEISISESARIYNGSQADLKFTTSLKFMQEMFERLTVIYRELLWSLPKKEREILELMAMENSSIRPNFIADTLDMDTREVSTYLSRLIERRYIKNVTEVSKKEKFYTPSEPLLSLWLKWRQGSTEAEKWSFVVDLLSSLFEKEELERIKGKGDLPPLLRGLYEKKEVGNMTLADVKAKAKELDIKAGKMTKDELIKQIQMQEGNFDCFGSASDSYCDQSDCCWRDDCLQAILKSTYESERWKVSPERLEEGIKLEEARTWLNKGIELGEIGRYEEAISCFDAAIKIDEKYADAWYNKGEALFYVNQYEDALHSLDKYFQLSPSIATFIKQIIKDFSPRIEEGINALIEKKKEGGIILFYLLIASCLIHSKEKNSGYIKKRVKQIKEWDVSSEEKNRVINESLLILFAEGRFGEILALKEIIRELKWEIIEENPTFIAAQIGLHLKEDNPHSALKIVENLDSVQRAVVERVLSTYFGENWLKEAREKLFP